jgi:hypothetical protein
MNQKFSLSRGSILAKNKVSGSNPFRPAYFQSKQLLVLKFRYEENEQIKA